MGKTRGHLPTAQLKLCAFRVGGNKLDGGLLRMLSHSRLETRRCDWRRQGSRGDGIRPLTTWPSQSLASPLGVALPPEYYDVRSWFLAFGSERRMAIVPQPMKICRRIRDRFAQRSRDFADSRARLVVGYDRPHFAA